MRRTCLVLLVLGFATVTSAQEMRDYRSAGRVGRIRTMREETAKLIDESGQLKESMRILNEETKFNEKGERLASRIIHPDGRTWAENTFRYEYDSEERIRVMEIFGHDGQFQYKFINTYNKNGKVNNKSYTDKDGQPMFDLIYAYNEAGKLSQMHDSRKSGKVSVDVVYTYSPEGIEADRKDYNADGILHERTITTYDADGKETEIVTFNAAGKVVGRSRFNYNSKAKNNVTEVVRSGAGDIVKSREYYTYDEFDETGNWIKRHTVREIARGSEIVKEMEVTYRTFTYY